MSINHRILNVPERITSAPNAIELVRIWANAKTVWVTLNLPQKWRDQELARLVCNTIRVAANVMAPRADLDEKTFGAAVYQTLFDQTKTSEQIEDFYDKAVREDAGHARKPEVRQAVKKNMAVIPVPDHENQDAIELLRIWQVGNTQEMSFRGGYFENINNCSNIIRSMTVYMANALYQRELKPSKASAEEELRIAIAKQWQNDQNKLKREDMSHVPFH